METIDPKHTLDLANVEPLTDGDTVPMNQHDSVIGRTTVNFVTFKPIDFCLNPTIDYVFLKYHV